LPEAIKSCVRWVDRVNRLVGRFAMYLLFGMMGILLWSSVSKTFFTPSLWTLEMAQFAMVAYYLLGGYVGLSIVRALVTSDLRGSICMGAPEDGEPGTAVEVRVPIDATAS